MGETISAPELTLESCRIAFENEVERSQLGALGSLPTDALVEVTLNKNPSSAWLTKIPEDLAFGSVGVKT